MLPSILSDFCLCGSYYHSCSLLKPVYFRCDLLNFITCIFYIFYEIRTLFIHTCIVYFSNNLQRFNQDLFILTTDLILFKAGSVNLNTSNSHRILTKRLVPRLNIMVEYKVCFGNNNINSNYLLHIGWV